MQARARAGIVAAAAAFMMGGAGTALAKTVGPLIGRGAVTGVGGLTTTNPAGPVFAGYLTDLPGGPDTTTSITFKVPTYNCAANSYLPTVGILGGLLDQNGFELATGGLEFDCGDGLYTLIAEGTNQTVGQSSTAVSPKDIVTVTLSADTTNGSVTTVDDQTRGTVLYVTDPTATSPAGMAIAALVDETGGGEIPKFGSIPFTNAFTNGQALGASNPFAVDLQSNTDIQAHTSALSASGKGFTVTFKHRR